MNDDRSGTIIGIVVYLLLAAGGAWLTVRFGASSGLVRPILHGVGYILAGQGILMAVRELRRLFEPDVVAALEAEEAEREKRARERRATLVSVLFVWLLALLIVAGFVFYALDDSGTHGERTLTLTLLFGGITLYVVGLAAWTTRSWWRRRACETVSDRRKTHEHSDPATV